MIIILVNFFVAFFFSFLGSIPPGTINLLSIQLGLENRFGTAIRFGIAAALAEYPYAWIAVKFEQLITTNPVILQNLQLAGSLIMIIIGIINLWPASKSPSPLTTKFGKSGFRRGLVLGLLNPLAVPYWLAMTAFLKSQNWIELTTLGQLQGYLIGVVLGAFLMLVIFAYLGKKIVSTFSIHPWILKIPGMTLLGLGLYTLAIYFMA